jgi:hypothetical protein
MFRVEQQNQPLPEGNYLELNGRKWRIDALTVNASQKICLRITDPYRFESQVLTLCSLSEFLQFNATTLWGNN